VPLCTEKAPEPKVGEENLTLPPNSDGAVKQIPILVIPSASGPVIAICISFAALAECGTSASTRENKLTTKKLREFSPLPGLIWTSLQARASYVKAGMIEMTLVGQPLPNACCSQPHAQQMDGVKEESSFENASTRSRFTFICIL